jgi:hypothetical protein
MNVGWMMDGWRMDDGWMMDYEWMMGGWMNGWMDLLSSISSPSGADLMSGFQE